MKQKMKQVLVLGLILVFCLTGCKSKSEAETKTSYTGQIYLYGEAHGVKKILDKENELWKGYYEDQGMRHLFVELPYYTAEWLNLWMKASDDTILNEVFADLEGTAVHKQEFLDYHKEIKEEMPETIFHGTDVGHQHDTTGKRYLKYLESQNLQESEAYKLTVACIEQGKYYYSRGQDGGYRENKMVENFITALSAVDNADIMGIYGSAHTGLDALDFSGKVDGMAKQLVKTYGNQVHSEDLSVLEKDIEPVKVEKMEIQGKSYEASYFGRQDLTGFKDYTYRDFWRIEGAYETFKAYSKIGDVLPFDNYPMLLELGQVFLIEYEKKDGSRERLIYISDGKIWEGQPSTERIVLP